MRLYSYCQLHQTSSAGANHLITRLARRTMYIHTYIYIRLQARASIAGRRERDGFGVVPDPISATTPSVRERETPLPMVRG